MIRRGGSGRREKGKGSSAASDVYKNQVGNLPDGRERFTDLAYQPLVGGTEMTFGFFVYGAQPETESMGG